MSISAGRSVTLACGRASACSSGCFHNPSLYVTTTAMDATRPSPVRISTEMTADSTAATVADGLDRGQACENRSLVAVHYRERWSMSTSCVGEVRTKRGRGVHGAVHDPVGISAQGWREWVVHLKGLMQTFFQLKVELNRSQKSAPENNRPTRQPRIFAHCFDLPGSVDHIKLAHI